MATRYQAEIARIDRSFFLARGFFNEMPKGKPGESKVIQRGLESGKTLEISRPVNLGAFHLLLLEALVAEAQYEETLREAAEKRKRGSRKEKKDQDRTPGKESLLVNLSYYKLAACMGFRRSTPFRQQANLALSDLSGTTLIFHDADGKELESCNLLSVVKSGSESGEPVLRLSLCPFLASPDANSSAWINMEEARRLKRKSAVLLHGWLSTRIIPCRQMTVSISDLLEGVIWPESPARKTSSERTRKHVLLNKILPDLVNAGWKADFDAARERIRFKRAPLPEEAHCAMAAEKCSYRVFWSEEDGGYLAVCNQFPSLSIPTSSRHGLWMG